MRDKVDINITAYCREFNSHISYRLSQEEIDNPKYLFEIVKTIEAQMDAHIQMKNIDKKMVKKDCMK